MRDEGTTDDGIPVVDDPAALEAAEDAARHAEDETTQLTGAPISSDERWVPIASAPGMDTGRSLEPIYEALCEAGIPTGFDPYRPGVAANPYPVVQRLFHVVVPESRFAEAAQALAAMNVSVPTEGITHPTSTSRTGVPGWRRYVAVIVALILVAMVVQLITTLLFEWGVLR